MIPNQGPFRPQAFISGEKRKKTIGIKSGLNLSRNNSKMSCTEFAKNVDKKGAWISSVEPISGTHPSSE